MDPEKARGLYAPTPKRSNAARVASCARARGRWTDGCACHALRAGTDIYLPAALVSHG
jgi:hypothetical protein